MCALSAPLNRGHSTAEPKSGAPSKEQKLEGSSETPLFNSTLNAVGDKKQPISFQRLAEVYKEKDKRTEHFLKTHYMKKDNIFVNYYEISQRAKQRRFAQYLNLTDTFNSFAKEKNLAMAFVTLTLKNNRYDENNVRLVKEQSASLRKLHRAIRDDRLFREPTKKRLQSLKTDKAWYHIPENRFQYIYTLEFQKDLTLHSHCAYYIPNEAEAFINLFDAVRRKRDRIEDIGRTEFVVPKKFMKDFKHAYDIEPLRPAEKNCYIIKGTQVQGGSFLYLKFINDEDEYQEDYFKQVMLYISKYVLKGAGVDRNGSAREKKEDLLIRYNRLRMVTYSRTLVPFYIFNRFYKELTELGIGLYELTKMWKDGNAEFIKREVDVIETEEQRIFFNHISEYKQYIDVHRERGNIPFEQLMNFYEMYERCYFGGDHSPNLTIKKIYDIRRYTEIELKISDITLTWSNEHTEHHVFNDNQKLERISAGERELQYLDINPDENEVVFNLF